MKHFHALMVLGALALAGCNADGKNGIAGGGGGGPGGDGGECLLKDPVTGMCIIGGPGTDTPNFTCTLPAAGAAVTSSESGPLCTLTDPLEPLLDTCSITDVANAADGSFTTPSTVQYVVGALDPGLGGQQALHVALPSAVAAGGDSVAAFLVDYPGGVVDASLLRALTVSTALGDTPRETATFESVLALDVLGLLGESDKILVGFRNQQSYDRMTLTVDSTLLTADITNAVNVYDACLGAVANE